MCAPGFWNKGRARREAPALGRVELRVEFLLEARPRLRLNSSARAHGMWTHEPRQGRKAATAVCSASAVVTLAWLISDGCERRELTQPPPAPSKYLSPKQHTTQQFPPT